MIYFATIDGGELTAILGAFGVILGGFYAFAVSQMKEARKERTTERKEFTSALNNVAASAQRVADETKSMKEIHKKGYREAEQRNGHLADLVIQQGEVVQKIADVATEKIITGIQNVEQQNIKHSHIEHETVEKETIKKLEE